ncbi:hypothetical protein [Eupransor demetentiae]|uniref:Capsid protein n=1 Tax=Eupransor demetentiae TaxID=3109584 RepID=A0ABM9N4M3_9LACO|nr:hypothetical protein R54876_GBNLAHCA_00681 [Lactobacillaceae bacterium LMG 33000]
MNMSTEIVLYNKAKRSKDPRVKQPGTANVKIGSFIANVTTMSAAKSYRDYGVVAYDQLIIRTAMPLPSFEFAIVDGNQYVPIEGQQVGYRKSVTVKLNGTKERTDVN